MAAGTATAAYYVSAVLYEVANISLTFCIDSRKGAEKYDAACNNMLSAYTAIQKQIEAMPARDVIKEGATLATEYYLSRKLLQNIGNFYKKTHSCAQQLKNKIGTAVQDWQRVVTTPEGVIMRMANKATHAMQNAGQAVGRYNGIIRKTTEQVCIKLHSVLDIQNRIAPLQNKFAKIPNFLKDLPGIKYLVFDFEHIFGIEFLEIWKKGKLLKNKLSGFHHDFLYILEKEGALQFINKKMGPCGSFMCDVIINGITYEDKSFFPATWTREIIVEKTLETMRKLTRKELQSNKNWLFEGYTLDGLLIRTIIDQTGKIITTFPLIGNP